MADTLDLEIAVHRWDAAHYTVELRLNRPGSDEDERVEGRMAFDTSHLLAQANDTEAYGLALGAHLLADSAIRAKCSEALRAAHNEGLRVRLRLLIGASAPELHSLRWELLRDPVDSLPVAFTDWIFFSRYLSSSDWQRVRIRPKTQLRALALIANPKNLADFQLSSIDTAAEQTRIMQALGKIQPKVLSGVGQATLQNLSVHLRDGYDIVYLVCHGMVHQGIHYLWLEDAAGNARQVPSEELAARMQEIQPRPRLVVLTACESGRSDNVGLVEADEALLGLGPRLARVGVPAVLAMQGRVQVTTVEQFMPAFFRELDQDGQIDRAMMRARNAVREHSDAWMPVLFMRLRSGGLWYNAGFADEQRGRGDNKWRPLIKSLVNEQCTPILGPDLAEGLFGSRREIAWRLAEDFKFPLEPNDREDLPQVAQYLAVNQGKEYLPQALVEYLIERLQQRHTTSLPEVLRNFDPRRAKHDDLLIKLDELMTRVWNERQTRDPPDVHRVLAELPVPIYITADPSNLLVTALENAGKEPHVFLCPWNDYSRRTALKVSEVRPTEQRPLVYYLFGRLQEPESLVLTEDAFFDYLIGVTSDKEGIPLRVREALVNSTLLFLGFHMEDWNFRVFFRTMMAQEGRDLQRDYAHIAVQITPEEGRLLQPRLAQQYFEDYFARGAQISVYWGTPEDFAEKLQRYWKGGRS